MRTIMNASLSQIQHTKGTRIIFAHVGKCAGGSIIQSLNDALDDDHAMFEMHVEGANQRLREAVESDPGDFVFLIAGRDPIDRFVSAFNWDKHNMYLSRPKRWEQVTHWFEEFPTVDILARSLSSNIRALEFARFAHMGMGQSYYTPLDLVAKLPRGRTFLIETERLAQDIRNFVDRKGVKIFHDKGDYASIYPRERNLFPKELSEQSRSNLRILLNDDFRVMEKLRKNFGQPTMFDHNSPTKNLIREEWND